MAASNPWPHVLTSPFDLMLSHHQERELYARLVGPLSQNPEQIKWVISLSLWFQSIGHNDFIRNVAASSDSNLLRFIDEGKACLIRLFRPLAGAAGEGDVDLPLSSNLMAEPMDLGFFTFNRETALEGVVNFFKKVCMVIFDDSIIEELVRTSHRTTKMATSSDPGYIMQFGEGMSTKGGNVVASAAVDASVPSLDFGVRPFVQMPEKSLLNPYAQPWKPVTKFASIDQRSMFVTFSRGYPISKQEIFKFFNMRYGKCVETVSIEKPKEGSPPLFGRIIFNNVSVISMILNGMATAKFMVNGKHLWARMFLPRHEQEYS